MMSRYRVTDQYGPYSGLSQKCTGSSRRSRAKKPCQVSSEYRYGLLTSISSSGVDQGSRFASALKSMALIGATTSFIGRSCRRFVPQWIALSRGLSVALEEREDLRSPFGRLLEG